MEQFKKRTGYRGEVGEKAEKDEKKTKVDNQDYRTINIT
jgi:hypothetical protein